MPFGRGRMRYLTAKNAFYFMRNQMKFEGRYEHENMEK